MANPLDWLGHQGSRLGYWATHGFDGRSDAEKRAGVQENAFGDTLARTGGYAGAGAAIGSAIPVVGTAIGGAIGAGLGLGESAWRGLASEGEKAATYSPELLAATNGEAIPAPAQSALQAAIQSPVGYPALDSLAQRMNQSIAANDALRQKRLAEVQGMANPYANGSGLQAALTASDNNVSRQYANAEGGLRESLAGRGMLGSGMEAGALAGLGAERAGAYSAGRNAIQSDYTDKAAQWDMNRQSMLDSIANNDLASSQASALYGALSDNGYRSQQIGQAEREIGQRERFGQADIDYRNAALAQQNAQGIMGGLGSMANWATQNPQAVKGAWDFANGLFGGKPAATAPASTPQASTLMPQAAPKINVPNASSPFTGSVSPWKSTATSTSLGYAPINQQPVSAWPSFKKR